MVPYGPWTFAPSPVLQPAFEGHWEVHVATADRQVYTVYLPAAFSSVITGRPQMLKVLTFRDELQ